jgi:hypothetical protein
VTNANGICDAVRIVSGHISEVDQPGHGTLIELRTDITHNSVADRTDADCGTLFSDTKLAHSAFSVAAHVLDASEAVTGEPVLAGTLERTHGPEGARATAH